MSIRSAGPELAEDHAPRQEGTEGREGAAVSGLDSRALIESAPDACLVFAADPPRFTVVAASGAHLGATMPRREGVVGRALFEGFPPDHDQAAAAGMLALAASLDEVVRTREPHRMPLQASAVRTPGGSVEERYLEPINTPVFDDRGRLVYIIHRVEDVTARMLSRRLADQHALQLTQETAAHARETQVLRETESLLERLRESESNFRALANSIPQLAWMADRTGRVFWYNERWYAYTGTTPEEMKGPEWKKVLHPDHLQRVVDRILAAFATGSRWEDTFPLRSSTGEYRWFLSRALPISDDTGAVVRWFGTNTDITEQIEAAAEHERLLEREREARSEADHRREALERVSESRTRLMRGFSHDLKNPLGAADGFAELLEEGIGGDLTDMQRRSVQRIRHSLKVSLRLIHDLLELARAEAGQIELRIQPVDVAKLVWEVADDFRGQADAAGLALEVDVPAPLPADSDPSRVRQVLSNLVSNAVKYTREGRVTVRAGMGADERAPRPGQWVAITVADTGPGIPADKLETIFLEFTRLDPNALNGAGVGLAISRRIARLLGGDVTVESEVGSGSTFTLWLPQAPRP
jgi:PAS domain S-box-containing protein